MDIIKIEIFTPDGWRKMRKSGDRYDYNDVTVKILNGKVSLHAVATPLYKMRIVYKNNKFKDALILADAWERAYSDLEWRKADAGRIMAWYFLAYDGSKIFGFGVKTQPNAMCYWTSSQEQIELVADVRNGTNSLSLKGSTLEVCTVVSGEYQEDVFSAAAKFCKLMCDNPRFSKTPIFGGNDWYCNYGENSFSKILAHTKRIVECSKSLKHKPYMVIDDGWQACQYQGETEEEYYNGGPWGLPNILFGDMLEMAKAISDCGAIPGIWYRPLLTIEKLPPDLVSCKKGMRNFLDPSNPDVLSLVKEDISRIKDWGYKLIKHDFSTFDIFGQYGRTMGEELFAREVNFCNRKKTTAQIIKNFYQAIRDAAGEDVLLMGCNTISHLSAGYFDIQRTGDDTSGIDWERTREYGVNTLAFRMCQHNRFYSVDADCVGITDKVDFEKNKQWLDVLAKSGTPLFVSIAQNCFTEEIKAKICEAFAYADKNPSPSKPLDWLENRIPAKWESDFATDKYNWF